jgi:hypothetical protein
MKKKKNSHIREFPYFPSLSPRGSIDLLIAAFVPTAAQWRAVPRASAGTPPAMPERARGSEKIGGDAIEMEAR